MLSRLVQCFMSQQQSGRVVGRLLASSTGGASIQESIEAINRELDELFGMPNTSEALEGVHHLPTAPSASSDLTTDTELESTVRATAASTARAATSAAPVSSLEDNIADATWTRAPLQQADGLTHVDGAGKAAMVDISHKDVTTRVARASARVLLGSSAYQLVAANQVQKGDVLTVAQLAGIMGAKHTSLLIPLCHPLALSKVAVELQLQPQDDSIRIHAMAKTDGKTGVEMEALTAVSVAALTVYDMCKAVSKDIVITDVKLEAKSGGKSADYVRESV